ncbi:MAG: isoleucine--tRNA ligase [Actinomycetota bacterium]
MAVFEPVDTGVSFPDLEREILAFWKDRDVFHASLAQREGAPLWIFYEGPPTANGKPGVHHVEPRTFKDVYPRFKTMTGHLVPRKGGWDCHGLPVELEVEKEIGTTGKRDIEAFGIAEFNELCRASVKRYVGEFERLTERIGYWVDLDEAYWTMAPAYVESVWWSLKSLFEKGLLREDDRVTAYCPRCGTALSDAEVAQGYETVEDPSVFVRFPIVEASDADLDGASLLVWTTTPWTLPSNAGIAVDPGATYLVMERDAERVIVAEPLAAEVLKEGWRRVRSIEGASLVGLGYQPPYPNVDGAHRVVAGAFVSMDDGTGIVHIAPAFGPEDLAVGRAHGWPMHKPVGDDGRFTDLAPEFVRGLFVKDADPMIVEDLRERGVLLRSETYEHNYPFCWRCKTPLLYYARTSWYVRTTEVKDRLLEVNDQVGWYPDHIKNGRYGNWLENNVDWALSRERYWGTPLPIWRCPQGHLRVVGSLTELGELAGRDVTDVDPHRPAIDEIDFDCRECGEKARRVPEVIDTWYDSGAMPFAQWGYHPELGRGVEEFERHFPADFISEAIDQTRGWFYTLMAEGVLHFDSTAYRNVACLGHIIAADGRKMSKSLGNMFDPWEALDRQGADALRWFMITNGSPWASRRIGHEVLDDVLRQFLLTLRHVHAFFVTYATADGFDPSSAAPPLAERPLLDRWVLSQLAQTVRAARDGLDAYDATGAGRHIERFVDDLSNWYVRRSRRRFWNPGGEAGEDASAAFHTLYECLVTISALLAPFTPFIADVMWRNLAAGRPGRSESVHLADYPSADEAAIDHELDVAMAAARTIVGLGRAVRTATKTRVRQPLSEAVVHLPGSHAGLGSLLDIVAEELNVHRVVFAESAESFGRWHAKPNFKALGPALGHRVKDVAAALGADDGALAGELASGASVTVASSGGEVSLGPGDVDLTQDVKQGWGVASEGGITLALDLELTDDLRREGVARELIRAIQDARKGAGLEIVDRIHLGVEAGPIVTAALAAHRETIAGETLALDVREEEVDATTVDTSIEGERVRISLRRADRGSPAGA